MAKAKSSSKKSVLKSRKFSRNYLIVFVLIFALIGGYLIWRTFAATSVGTLEAETMTGATAIVTDSAASGGKAVKLSNSNAITGTLSATDTINSLVLKARGDQCFGSPAITVSVDGKNVLTANLSSTSWTNYTLTANFASGNHAVSVSFTNPYTKQNKNRVMCVRAAVVDVLTAFHDVTTPPPPSSDTTPPTVSVTSPTGGTTVSGTISVSANASDNVGVTKVEFYIDGVMVSSNTASPYNYSWLTTSYSNASHIVKAVAYDAANNNSSSSVTVTVSNVAPPPPTGGTTLFEDNFTGTAGSTPDLSKWIQHTENCDPPNNYACIKKSNAFLDGAGNLILRTKRETANYLSGGPFSSAWISTFNYGSGWPPTVVNYSFTPPYHVEARMLMGSAPGLWGGPWSINTDRPTSQNIYELDWAEERSTYMTTADCHQHTWLGGKDTYPWDCGGKTVTNMSLNWHTFAADVYTDKVIYYIDGVVSKTAYGVSGKQGILLNFTVAPPGSWGSGGQQPASTDPGPWDMKIDYVRVTSL